MIRYAIQSGQDREGEFCFLCSTQSNMSPSLKGVRKDLEEMIEEYMNQYDPPQTRSETIEEFGPFKILKLTIEEVP